ncbi:MAG: hypothetical protein K8R67_12455 [Desulfobacteraceae bacterium]|nr:hypothetical protein [Desulfobacteraceae bacterium]
MNKLLKNFLLSLLLIFAVSSFSIPAYSDHLIYDDLIVTGSECLGFDCVNGESFGYDTLVLKENNLRIYFNDTSASASFPTNDWRIQINDSANGGKSYFGIQDASAGRQVFTIEAGAPANALYVEDYGRVGLGTSIPYVELHIADGDTPTVRLDQDGSSGWSPQSWDVAGNESNFFIRDVTNGSKLPFRIQPSTPSSTLCLKADGKVGIGTWSPDAPLHVEAALTGPVDTMLVQNTTGPARLVLQNDTITPSTTGDPRWIINSNGTLRISSGTSSPEFILNSEGDLTVAGSFFSGTAIEYPDYVFDDNYPLMPLSDLKRFIEKEGHLPNITNAEEVKKAGGVNVTKLQIKLLEKVEELTLYTIKQQTMIEELKKKIEGLEN